MGTLADEIAKLTDPTPRIVDPEDDINIETTAKVSDKYDEGVALDYQVSSLRKLNAPLLDQIDERYAGKKVSRVSLNDSFDHDSEQEDSQGIDEEEDDSDDNDEDSDEDDQHIASFKQYMNKKELNDGNVEIPNHSGAEFSDSFSEDTDENSEDEGDDDDQDEDDEEEEENDIIQKFSQIDVESQIEKGKAVKKQQEFWNKLCECRIKLQKLLLVANRLPQHDQWKDFKDKSEKTYTSSINKGYRSVSKLLGSLLQLQTDLLKEDLDFQMTSNTSTTSQIDSNMDEEIPSDSDVDEDRDAAMETSGQTKEKQTRKRKLESFEDILSKQHKIMIPYRNVIIQKWDNKTRLSTGKMTQKSFNAFDQSALKQIDQILQDKPRLIRRTQLKRSVYTVLGKTEPEELQKQQTVEASDENKVGAKYDHLKDYDSEIFDDDDFYRRFLKDIIQTKSATMDPVLLSKQLEIQKIRSKMKRKVDTKASKGRKIRFSVHAKLVNFMAPVTNFTMFEEARDQLFKSLFGQSCTSSNAC